MECQECQKRPATVHFTRIINGNKHESHLCEYCAQAKGELKLEPYISINQLLTGLLHHEAPTIASRSEGESCPECDLTYGEFARTGRLGCGECYSHFGSRLEPLLKRIHAASSHTGKVPKKAGTHVKLRREIEQMRSDLSKAVESEQYEEAAVIRDKIKELKDQLK